MAKARALVDGPQLKRLLDVLKSEGVMSWRLCAAPAVLWYVCNMQAAGPGGGAATRSSSYLRRMGYYGGSGGDAPKWFRGGVVLVLVVFLLVVAMKACQS